VVELGDDDLGAGSDVVEQGEGQVAEELGRGGSEDDAVGSGVHVGCCGFTSLVVSLCGLLGDGIACSELDVCIAEIVGDAIALLISS
jgi:hypothetical protein